MKTKLLVLAIVVMTFSSFASLGWGSPFKNNENDSAIDMDILSKEIENNIPQNIKNDMKQYAETKELNKIKEKAEADAVNVEKILSVVYEKWDKDIVNDLRQKCVTIRNSELHVWDQNYDILHLLDRFDAIMEKRYKGNEEKSLRGVLLATPHYGKNNEEHLLYALFGLHLDYGTNCRPSFLPPRR